MLVKKLVEIPLKAEVHCQDGRCGHVSGVILNPITHELTHFVLRKDGLVEKEYLVPVDLIASSANRVLQLRCTNDEIANLGSFHQTKFLQVDPHDYPQIPEAITGGFYEWPYVRGEEGYTLAVETETVPADELAIHRGATVEATDGKIGRVDEFLVDADGNQVSHIVLSQGHLWGKHDIIIPISAVARVADDTVFLTLDKEAVGELPRVPVQRDLKR